MAYSNDMKSAADRHFVDGQKLLAGRRYDNAGYHFGLAAECAIKKLLQDLKVPAHDDAIWKHFPALRGLATAHLRGRTASKARAMLSRQNFMQEWDIAMRYSLNGEVTETRANHWKDCADEAIGLIT